MDDAEVLSFLDEERVLTCATQGPRGFPHLMPLWYVVRDGRLWASSATRAPRCRSKPAATSTTCCAA
jgi:nitroimidazol reductase NimA-like FMN-containing flavoprotein (pyridoxamine 5'-phosphate oxidase superfamily)